MNIIIVFPKAEDAKGIKNILVKNGFSVAAVCTTGAQVLNYTDSLNGGIVISGYRLQDMIYEELHACLPRNFDMLLVASQRYFAQGEKAGIMSLPMPVKTYDFLNTVDMMMKASLRRRKKKAEKPAKRTEEEKKLIEQAKHILMERNSMTEEEAHRYIQKCSMDSGTSIVEMAQMVLQMML